MEEDAASVYRYTVALRANSLVEPKRDRVNGPACRRRMERIDFSSVAGGSSRRKMESEVAMSLSGMPTASLAPRSR